MNTQLKKNKSRKKKEKKSWAGWCMPLILVSSPQEAEARRPVSLRPVWSPWQVPGQTPSQLREKKDAIQYALEYLQCFIKYYCLIPEDAHPPKGALDLGSPYLFFALNSGKCYLPSVSE